ncbi:hypothetical protein EVA_09206 [gut metagenome]|uniref:Uncharacterized protein n=1 Tax=gut metagenome TaxID=749906 RepID=J9G738_9ZZZZ
MFDNKFINPVSLLIRQMYFFFGYIQHIAASISFSAAKLACRYATFLHSNK